MGSKVGGVAVIGHGMTWVGGSDETVLNHTRSVVANPSLRVEFIDPTSGLRPPVTTTILRSFFDASSDLPAGANVSSVGSLGGQASCVFIR